MTFEALLQLWWTEGHSGVAGKVPSAFLVPLEPWIRPIDLQRAPLRTAWTPAPSVPGATAKDPTEVTTEVIRPLLRLVHSHLGERYPAHQIPIELARKTVRNVYAHVAIGRSINNDVVMDQPSVSRFHADIRTLEGAFQVHDAKSRNGTRLNGEELPAGRGQSLTSGDVITFGEASCVFCDRSEEGLFRVLGPPKR